MKSTNPCKHENTSQVKQQLVGGYYQVVEFCLACMETLWVSDEQMGPQLEKIHKKRRKEEDG